MHTRAVGSLLTFSVFTQLAEWVRQIKVTTESSLSPCLHW